MSGLNFLLNPQTPSTVPLSSEYVFPSQSTRCFKSTVKYLPKDNVTYYSSTTTGQLIKFNLPASGYLNPCETVLNFNVQVAGTFSASASTINLALQDNIQSIFRRCRILYGSLVLEDIQDYATLCRILTLCTAPPRAHRTQIGMMDGVGRFGKRLNYHSITYNATQPNLSTVRRYSCQLFTGLFMQRKLIPLKWMSSQLQIELELAPASETIELFTANAGTITNPEIRVSQVELLAQILEFDTKFDEGVFEALQYGLPIQFQSWHCTYQQLYNTQNNLQIQERARSVRGALAVIMDDSLRTSFNRDWHTFFAAGGALTSVGSNLNDAIGGGTNMAMPLATTVVENYQFRIGGRYYPAQPVNVTGNGALQVGSSYDVAIANPSPSTEAWFELQKLFNNLDFKQTMFNFEELNINNVALTTPYINSPFAARDYNMFSPNSGVYNPLFEVDGTAGKLDYSNSFIIAGDFATDRGDVISGLNAEENTDLQLSIKFLNGPVTNKYCRICIWYDAVIIITRDSGLSLIL